MKNFHFVVAAATLAGGLTGTASHAAAPAPGVTPLVQLQGANGWAPTGAIAKLGKSYVAATEADSTVNLFSPPASPGGAWTNQVIYSLGAGTAGGLYPHGGVVVKDGAIYGDTTGGGSTACANGCGTVFMLSPPAAAGGSWSGSQLAVFANDNNGYAPSDTVLLKGATLYGTTTAAANDTAPPNGATPAGGVVYALTKPASGSGPWTETVLHHFDAASGDGYYPFGGLIAGPGGTLIGTTYQGGACNYGIVYALTPPAQKGGAWTETHLHDFGMDGGTGCDYGDGELPVAALALSGATVFGTTSGGGNGCGTAFAITLGATPAYQRIHEFGQGAGDSCSPQAPLRVGGGGVIYGTSAVGGTAAPSAECLYGCGTIFTLTPAGGGYSATVLYSFTGGTDGSEPRSNLLGKPGKTLFATASHGGFAADTGAADYASFGVFFQFAP